MMAEDDNDAGSFGARYFFLASCALLLQINLEKKPRAFAKTAMYRDLIYGSRKTFFCRSISSTSIYIQQYSCRAYST